MSTDLDFQYRFTCSFELNQFSRPYSQISYFCLKFFYLIFRHVTHCSSMLNTSISTQEVNHRMTPLLDANVGPTTSSTSSSAGLVSVVIVCMTIMAVCALAYFAIRCYFDERRWRASALLCKCLPPASAASVVECGNPCRYVERRAVNVAVQTGAPSGSEGAVGAASATVATNCWSMSDVRISEAKRVSGCAFSSPLANNSEAIPNWRPPATGSSQRQGSHYYRLQKSSQRQKHRHQRQIQRQYYREVQHHQDDECQHYPLRRVRPVSMMPSIQVQSPSSSESYSVLAMSTHSKSAALNKEFTAVTFSGSDGEDGLSQLHHNHHQYSKSGLSEGHSYGSTNPYHPRYNTPVSEINNNDMEVVVATADIEQVVPVIEVEEKEDNEKEREIRPELMNQHLFDRVMNDRKWSRSPSSCSVVDGLSTSAEQSATAASAATTTTNTTMATTIQLVDEATQSCPSSVGGWMAGNLKACQTSRTNSSCSLNLVSAGFGLSLDTVRSGLPLKGTFPSFEVLPGGRLINRRTQTDNASLASLDWDNYDCERLRSEMEEVNLDDDDFEGGDGYHRLTNVDEGVEGMTSSATMLASSNVSADTTLQASRISHRSTSSPYVLCFECSDDFALAQGRRTSAEFFNPRHTSSSSPASRYANRRHQRSVAPPSPPAPPNLSSLSPPHSSNLLQPDSQDGRSSKSVRPRRK